VTYLKTLFRQSLREIEKETQNGCQSLGNQSKIQSWHACNKHLKSYIKAKCVPPHAMKALEGRGSIDPTHS
jgi:hypothetical protein